MLMLCKDQHFSSIQKKKKNTTSKQAGTVIKFRCYRINAVKTGINDYCVYYWALTAIFSSKMVSINSFFCYVFLY